MAVNEALPFDEPEDDVAVARAEPAHGPQAVEDGPSMWMRAGRPDATRATEARPRAPFVGFHSGRRPLRLGDLGGHHLGGGRSEGLRPARVTHGAQAAGRASIGRLA